jgi:hypothetical protein
MNANELRNALRWAWVAASIAFLLISPGHGGYGSNDREIRWIGDPRRVTRTDAASQTTAGVGGLPKLDNRRLDRHRMVELPSEGGYEA